MSNLNDQDITFDQPIAQYEGTGAEGADQFAGLRISAADTPALWKLV